MKKIRVTLSEDIWRLIGKDVEEFGINSNRLCNYILDKLKYEKNMDIHKLIENSTGIQKKIIQFDLNSANETIYYDILRENGVENEAEFFRNLFELYTSKFKYQREIFVFMDRVLEILDAIDRKCKMKIIYYGEVYTVNPYFIKREEQGDENFLFCYHCEEKKYLNFKLKDLAVGGILQEKIDFYDKKYIEMVKKNFDPFLGYGNIVKVKLSPKGEGFLKGITNYKPKLKKREGNIYSFEMSNENAKIYFLPFMENAEILSPPELREEMRNSLLSTLKLYS
ncbi:MAG: WYL domain-containing protein [Fusobacteriaceae bacterium]